MIKFLSLAVSWVSKRIPQEIKNVVSGLSSGGDIWSYDCYTMLSDLLIIFIRIKSCNQVLVKNWIGCPLHRHCGLFAQSFRVCGISPMGVSEGGYVDSRSQPKTKDIGLRAFHCNKGVGVKDSRTAKRRRWF